MIDSGPTRRKDVFGGSNEQDHVRGLASCRQKEHMKAALGSLHGVSFMDARKNASSTFTWLQPSDIKNMAYIFAT
jgi:hypothetical protein